MPAMKRPLGSSQTTVAKRVKKTPKAKGSPEMYAKGQVFPDVLYTTLRYNSNMYRRNPASASDFTSYRLNSAYDFDVDDVAGNKQPLYFDELVTSTGPYQTFTVKSWMTKVEIHNMSTSPLLCYWVQASNVTEGDTLIEVQNRTNVRELILTGRGGDGDHGIIRAPGKITDIYGTRLDPANLVGNSASGPNVTPVGILYLYNPGGVVGTPVDAWVKVTHDFHCELNTSDAIIS